MPFLVIDTTPGCSMPEEAAPARFPNKSEAVRFAQELAQEYRSLGHRIKRHRLQWFCEQSRRECVVHPQFQLHRQRQRRVHGQ